mgnify:CR=1 FL=1
MKTKLMTAIAAAGIATATAGFANPTVGGAPMMADMTIAENASNAPNLSTLVAAVKAAGLAQPLMSDSLLNPVAAAHD